MLRKLKQKFTLWRLNRRVKPFKPPVESYTQEQLEKAFMLGYTDGKRDGLTVAREQATKSLKEILWQQNKNQPKK
jgi:hypothetical protein